MMYAVKESDEYGKVYVYDTETMKIRLADYSVYDDIHGVVDTIFTYGRTIATYFSKLDIALCELLEYEDSQNIGRSFWFSTDDCFVFHFFGSVVEQKYINLPNLLVKYDSWSIKDNKLTVVLDESTQYHIVKDVTKFNVILAKKQFFER